MAKVKLLKYPKKPKSKASQQVLDNYIEKCKQVDKENKDRLAKEKKRLETLKKIANLKN